MKNVVVAFVAWFMAISHLLADVSDAQLRGIFDRACRYIDDPDGPSGEIRYAIQQTGGDTNRVVSLMKQIIEEGTDSSAAAFYISEMGKYGTTNDLAFLYRQVSMTKLSEVATETIIRLEGLTTNSVARITSLLPSDAGMSWDAMCARCLLLEESEKLPIGSPAKDMVLSNALDYASRLTNYVDILDGSITRVDPSYRMSKRRLGVLRAVQNLGVNEWQTNFVATAIRELEAYAEADLPE